MKNKLEKLESIRGLAAIYVVLHHTFKNNLTIKKFHLSFLLSFGQEAVILFFILSGFVIKYSFSNIKNEKFTTYFLKRFLRIYIPLLIVFLTNFLILHFYETTHQTFSFSNFLGNIFMLQDIKSLKLGVICDPFLGNSPLWSLSYEWWFYMLFFGITRWFSTEANKIVMVTSILSSFLYLFFPDFGSRLFLYLLIWWTGVIFAELYISGQNISIKNMKEHLVALTICLCVLLVNLKLNRENGLSKGIGISPWLEIRHFSFAICISITAILWKNKKWLGFTYFIGPFKKLAPISFVIYISHYFLVSDAHYLDFISNLTIRYLSYLTICISYSYIVEIKISQPARNFLLKKYFSRNSAIMNQLTLNIVEQKISIRP